MNWRARAHQQGAAIPQPDPTAWFHLFMPVRLNRVWDGKTPTQFLFSQSLLQPRMATFFSSGQWDMNRWPLEKFWDRCHCPGPFFLLHALKVELKAGFAAFWEKFSPQASFLAFSVQRLQCPKLLCLWSDTIVPWWLLRVFFLFCVFIFFPPCSDLSRTWGAHRCLIRQLEPESQPLVQILCHQNTKHCLRQAFRNTRFWFAYTEIN